MYMSDNVGKNTIAMVLAGGKGERLSPLTLRRAKPSVAFGGKYKIIDFVLGNFDFAGVHLESCDLGCCHCPQCAGKDGVVAYNARVNRKTADYIKSK